MEKISVIIPVYNVAKYLPECLDSILGQTYKAIEVICVNDGSTDESGLILEEYAAKDRRVKVIYQENAGVSAARNAGLDAATGEYISFVDGDDYLDLHAFEALIKEVAEAPETDIFVFGNYNVYDGSVLNNSDMLKCLTQYVQNGFSKKDFVLDLGASVWGKLFKRRFIEEHHIRFAKGVPLAEDGLFGIECILADPKVRIIVASYYFYRIFRENSTMATQNDLDKEMLGRDYMQKQPFYQKASREDKFIMDIKICANLCYRYSLLEDKNRLRNLHYLEDYRVYLEREYTKQECASCGNYQELCLQIKCKGHERLTFLQKVFSIKNTRDKRQKVVRVLGFCFYLNRKTL